MGDAAHIVKKILFGVSSKIDRARLLYAHVKNFTEFLDIVEYESGCARCEETVPSSFRFRRLLQYHHLRSGIMCRERGTNRRIARAYHHNIYLLHVIQSHFQIPIPCLSFFTTETKPAEKSSALQNGLPDER